jgi:hypothetical protein
MVNLLTFLLPCLLDRRTSFMFYWARFLSNLLGEVQRRELQRERERDARPFDWRPRSREEANQAAADEEALEEAEKYEKSRQWNKALAIYRDLAADCPDPDIVVKAKMRIKRVKRAQGR